MKVTVLIFILLFTNILNARVKTVYKSFASDGCSYFPDGIPNNNGLDEWKYCCVIHDVHYWRGGTKEQKIDADFELQNCVDEAISDRGSYTLGMLMFIGVDIGGAATFGDYISKLPFRWGFGHKSHFKPRDLSVVELKDYGTKLSYYLEKLNKGFRYQYVDDEGMAKIKKFVMDEIHRIKIKIKRAE